MKYTPDFSSRFRILKGGKISLVVSALVAGSTMSFASPTGGQVTSGSASITQNGSVTTINQSTQKASINWNSFSIAPSETVNFVQPSSQSVTLNRVVGTTQSLIQGAMNANGQVFLLNPNGVLFANGSEINVGGLVASTLNITDQNFQAGNYLFEGNSQNSIINMGTITASNGGYVAMMGKTVQNEGTIVATMGNVQMASGEKISLNLNGNSLVKLTIDQGTLNALVENKGLIHANGGQVYLTTQALNTILDGMVNNTGVIEAQTLGDVTGKVVLYAHGGTANVGGTLDASAPTSGNGGFVETSGDTVNILENASVCTKSSTGKTGTWLIDPRDFVVASSGGNITGAQVASMLNGTDFVIQTTTMGNDGGLGKGDIFINDAISWGSNKLTLLAQRHINVNALMSMSGTAALEIGYGWNGSSSTPTYGAVVGGVQSGINMGFNSTHTGYAGKINITAPTTNTVKINGSDYTIITDATSLAAISNSGNYILANDITSGMAGWDGNTMYSSVRLNGFGHVIDGLTSSRGGLFKAVSSSAIENMGLTNVVITDAVNDYASYGGLVGYASTVQVRNSFVSGSISGGSYLGGLVGNLQGDNTTIIDNSFFKGTIASTGIAVGGLVGGMDNNKKISYSFSEATVTSTGSESIGGLAGFSGTGSSISDSYSIGDVTGGGQLVGGLVGFNNGGSVTNSFAAGTVTSTTSSPNVYGLSGGYGTFSNSYYVSSLNNNDASMADKGSSDVAHEAALTAAIGTSYELVSGNTLPTLKSKYGSSSVTSSTTTYYVAPTSTATLPTPTVQGDGFTSLAQIQPSSFSNGTPVLNTDYSITIENALEELVFDSSDNSIGTLATLNALPAGTYIIYLRGQNGGDYSVPNASTTLTINEVSTATSTANTVVQNQVNNVVTTIVNSTTVTPPAPMVVAPVVSQQQAQTLAQNNVLLQSIMPQGSSNGGSFGLVGSTDGNTPVQIVSMEQLQSASGGQGGHEIRVPLGNGSLIELVSGGLNLPQGVSQEFYVVDNTKLASN